jgi:hypothetical protein
VGRISRGSRGPRTDDEADGQLDAGAVRLRQLAAGDAAEADLGLVYDEPLRGAVVESLGGDAAVDDDGAARDR